MFQKMKNKKNEKLNSFSNICEGSSAVASVLDCDILDSEFEPLSQYYVHFQTNTLGKGINLFIVPPLAMEIILLQLFFY